MSGIIAVYALVIAVLIAGDMAPPPGQSYALFNGFMHLACGLSVGLSGVAAGYAMGVVGDMVRKEITPLIRNIILTFSGCTIIHATITSIRRHGSNSDFRRSPWTIRVCLLLSFQ